MESIRVRKEEYKMTEGEWFSTWMYIEAAKRKGMELYELNQLRDVVKTGGEEVLIRFREKYKELWV